MQVSEAVATRRSVRGFLPDPVDPAVIRRVLERAARAPSGGNLQPWHIDIVAGERLAELKTMMLTKTREAPGGEPTEYDIYPKVLTEPYTNYRFQVGEDLYGALGIPRESKRERMMWFARNFQFFGAPMALFCSVAKTMGPPQWSDLGMYLQTVMLLLREEGLDSCPQECWAIYPQTIRAFIGIPEERMLFTGMAIGHKDPADPANAMVARRAPLDAFAKFPRPVNWARLEAARHRLAGMSLARLFDDDAERLERLTLDVPGLHFDFAKLAVDAGVLADLAALADAADLADWRARLFAGAVVNPSEGRAATHPHERGSGSGPALEVAAAGKAAMRELVERVRGDGTRHILHIGIGGSALGPALLVDALGHHGDGPAIEIVANIDGVALERALARCDPARTRVVVVSKTFTTQETMTNAASALDWLAAAGVPAPRARVVAVTAAPDRARAWGAADVLPFAETVGGRYSLWSAVGLPLALRCGWAAFEALLAGAAAMDTHFATAPFARNAPVLAGALDVWAASVQGQRTRGVFAYDERLRLLPSFLQQLEMESNGKRVSRDGGALDRPTAPVTWGGTGTDAQHAVFQLLHQGMPDGPVEFVAVREPGHALGGDHHAQLLANCFAQGAALMRGRTFEEALAKSDGDPALAAAKTFPGNRPSATILLDRLDARTLGSLLAFYEHRTFTAACLLGINPFDQWGVELGKEMANAMGQGGSFDASTEALMRRAGL